MISEWWWIGKDLAGSGRGLILKYYPRIRLEELRKTTENLSQDSRSSGRKSNPWPPEYEAGVPTVEQLMIQLRGWDTDSSEASCEEEQSTDDEVSGIQVLSKDESRLIKSSACLCFLH
jgi:hypothetical protein